jgi:hypothetical protein
MSYLSTRLGLTLDTTADAFLTSDVRGDFIILDMYPGLYTDTTAGIASQTAGWGSAQEGQYVSDTDTGLVWYWTGSDLIRPWGIGMLDKASVTSPVTVTSVLSSRTTLITLTTDIPPGGRDIEVKCIMTDVANTTQDTSIFLYQDSTVIQSCVVQANLLMPVVLFAEVNPSAASHTYSVQAGVASASTTTFDASATSPILLTVVEL